MNFDLRLPIGLMFSLYGILLVTFGVISDKAIYICSLNINMNLVWGLALLVFGAFNLVLVWRNRRKS